MLRLLIRYMILKAFSPAQHFSTKLLYVIIIILIIVPSIEFFLSAALAMVILGLQDPNRKEVRAYLRIKLKIY